MLKLAGSSASVSERKRRRVAFGHESHAVTACIEFDYSPQARIFRGYSSAYGAGRVDPMDNTPRVYGFKTRVFFHFCYCTWNPICQESYAIFKYNGYCPPHAPLPAVYLCATCGEREGPLSSSAPCSAFPASLLYRFPALLHVAEHFTPPSPLFTPDFPAARTG